MSIELRSFIDKENLILDCKRLHKFKKMRATCENIDNLVCDTIDKLCDEGLIQHKETVDVAYYIANEIKREFIV